MDSQLPDPTADALSEDILSGMREWRLSHPDASLTEIEQALDERWYRLAIAGLGPKSVAEQIEDHATRSTALVHDRRAMPIVRGVIGRQLMAVRTRQAVGM